MHIYIYKRKYAEKGYRLELTSTGCALLNAIISAREREGEYDKFDR
jgi:hypothetical protein